jgi:hypothetical protein
MPNGNSRPAHSCYRCNHAPLAKRTTLVRSKGCLSNKTSLAMIFKVAEAAEKSWRRLDGQNQSPKVILSDRKLKLPPPDPFRHQDSAIALRRGPSGGRYDLRLRERTLRRKTRNSQDPQYNLAELRWCAARISWTPIILLEHDNEDQNGEMLCWRRHSHELGFPVGIAGASRRKSAWTPKRQGIGERQGRPTPRLSENSTAVSW